MIARVRTIARVRVRTIAVALAIACPSVVAPSPARAAEPIAEDGTLRGWAHVAVDTSAIGEAGPAIRRRVQERADVVLRRAGIMPGRGPQDPTISVVIREVDGDEPGWAYAITITRAEQVTGANDPHTCPLCTETELVDAIEGRLATIAAELEGPADDPATAGDPTAAPTETTPPSRSPTDAPVDRGLRPSGKAGVALVVTGGLGLVTGLVLAVLPARPKSGDPTREVYTQPPGYALLGVGAATLVVGAVLLGLDRRRAKTRGHARVQLGRGGLRF